MWLWALRVFFLFITTAAGYNMQSNNFTGAFFGFMAGLLILFFEMFARKVSLRGLSSTVFGIILGLLLAKIFNETLKQFNLPADFITNISAFITIIFVYLGLTLGIKGRSEFSLVIPYVKFKRQELQEETIVIDTSVIIDGRILDIVKTGFIEGRFVIPFFVLNELRALADSTEHIKRQKGKRGIEILHALKKEPNIEVIIHNEDIEEVKSVDEKIIRVAQELDAKVLTTDYNLNRIAQLQEVKVLNINDLANALKPIFIAGERLSIKLIKEGKEHNQAVGYLEDGTMVVVENAKWLIGKTVDVEVTSVLQSPSGRIVFTKLLS
ncbi:MAG: PIN domain-containing protein [Candidatus Omnitrophica bacterium]|nr:PIN domain-containing protein [Candidatus Omnitrophota bacterium]MCM8831688.1 PIN domain-containing protein [Candidatus Omnitrophota bacterium]